MRHYCDIILINTLEEVGFLEALNLAHKIVDVLGDKQAVDIVMLDVKDICNFSDYFVICTGESERQIKAIMDAVSDFLRKENDRSLHVEGTPRTGWILADYGDVILHIFSPVEREYYQIESLWEKASTVVRIQ